MNYWLLVVVGYKPGVGLVFRWYNCNRVNGLMMDFALAARGLAKAFNSLHSSLSRFKEAVGAKALKDDLDWYEGW